MKKLWVGTGWKMNKLLGEAQEYLARLRSFLESEPGPWPHIFLVPPFTILREVVDSCRGLPVEIAAQNMHWESDGAYTGEISPGMVKDCGAGLVELGHSERRAMFNETDETVNLKVLAALAHGLRPLVCVGESALEKACGASAAAVGRQVRMALARVPAERVPEVILAYEPVWAIGDEGRPAEATYADAVHGAIDQALTDLYGPDTADRVPLLYGGSVNLNNARSFLEQTHIDGVFVGRSAWQADGLVELIKTAVSVQENGGKIKAG